MFMVKQLKKNRNYRKQKWQLYRDKNEKGCQKARTTDKPR
jgi:hypothetical protein